MLRVTNPISWRRIPIHVSVKTEKMVFPTIVKQSVLILAAAHGFRRFLSRFSADFQEILQTLYSGLTSAIMTTKPE